jgi:hypothetical protein
LKSINQNITYITFLPNGSIDWTHTSHEEVDSATFLLTDAIKILQSQMSKQLDFWKLINWFVVSVYWSLLFDLGQVFTVNLDSDDLALTPSTNNIFINQTLFDIYSSFLVDTIGPLEKLTGIPVPSFEPISSQNYLQARDTTFLRSYSCVERHVKPVISLLISVIVADYALIMGAYTFAINVAGMIQKRRHYGEFLRLVGLMGGKYCVGCEELAKYSSDDSPDGMLLRRYPMDRSGSDD